MNIEVVKADITTLEVDAIQNAANGMLRHGAGVAGAIQAAGGERLALESNAIIAAHWHLAPGQSVWTSAGEMETCSYVIHAVTMRFPGERSSRETVQLCTKSTLRVADVLHCESVALCALGTGIGGVRMGTCADAMCDAIWQMKGLHYLKNIYFAVFDEAAQTEFDTELARRAGMVAT